MLLFEYYQRSGRGEVCVANFIPLSMLWKDTWLHITKIILKNWWWPFKPRTSWVADSDGEHYTTPLWLISLHDKSTKNKKFWESFSLHRQGAGKIPLFGPNNPPKTVQKNSQVVWDEIVTHERVATGTFGIARKTHWYFLPDCHVHIALAPSRLWETGKFHQMWACAKSSKSGPTSRGR